MSRVLVTGATGFVGRRVCPLLVDGGYQLSIALRGPAPDDLPAGAIPYTVGDIGPDTDWRAALDGVAAVVHLAARAHVMHETADNPGAEYRRANAEATAALAEQAAAAGIERFVFVSTVKVNGEATHGRPFGEHDPPAPEDAYGVSKWAAERALTEISERTGLPVVILRAPLMYGPGVKGNFLSLLGLCEKSPTLPFSSLRNRRSLLFVGNMADAIRQALQAAAAAGVEVYFVRDGDDVSTPQLISRLSEALGHRPRQFPLPVGLLRLIGALGGKAAAVDRLTGSLQVDDTKIREQLGWTPPFSMVQGLAETAAWYKNREGC